MVVIKFIVSARGKSHSDLTMIQVAALDVVQDVIAVTSEQRNDPPPDLPHPGVLPRPKLKVGELAFTMKVSYFSLWVLCRVLEVIPRNITEVSPADESVDEGGRLSTW